MSTKLISFVCVLALASISYGAGVPMFAPPPATMLAPGDPDGGVLVADWQNSFDTLMLGWGDAMMGFTGTGATRNGTALKAVCSPGGWATAFSLKLDGFKHSDYTVYDAGPKQVCPSGYANNEDFLNWLLDNCDYSQFEIDVTVETAGWVEDDDPLTDPSIGMFMVLNSGGYDNAGNASGLWAQLDTINLAQDSTTRCVWNFSAAKQDAIDNFATYCNDRYFEVFLVTMSDGYITGTYNMDNARITTPEPATIALLGLGALSLIRRKR